MHVVVTGASSGIGKALAQAFSQAGHQVTLVARRKDLLDQLVVTLPNPALAVTCDLSNVETCTQWIEQAEKKFGPVDVLVNNAGAQIIEPTEETQSEAGEAVLRVNLVTPFRLIRAFSPHMIQRRSGTIVNIASMIALAPMPGTTYYNASKAGLAAASEAMRAEFKPFGVNVITVYPGPVTSPMLENANKQFGNAFDFAPTGTAEGLAKLVLKAIRKKKARVVYPAFYHLSRHLPALSRWVVDVTTPSLKRRG